MKNLLLTACAIGALLFTEGCLPTLTVTNYTICQGNTVPAGQGMQASTTLSSPIDWYTSATGGSPVFTGPVFNPVGVTGSGITNTNTAGVTTFYAIEQTSSNSRSAVTFTINTSPTATITPSTTTVCPSSNATLNANTGTGLTYQWKLNGTNISGATNASYTTNVAGSYTVAVSNANCGPVTSTAVVLSTGAAPSATITPAGPTTFCLGGNVVLNATSGSGLSYQWQKNNVNISGATNAAYTATASGSYTVIVSYTATGCNNTSSAVTVNANSSFTMNATAAGPLSFCTGNNVTLTATASSPGLSYQWRFNGGNITGATDSIYAAAITGSYDVVVIDPNSTFCQQTSTPFSITAFPLPNSFITYMTPLAFCADGAVVLTANTDPGLSYQWNFNSNPISGATSYFEEVNKTGTYSVNTTDGHNCSALSPDVAVTVYPKPAPVVTRNGYTLSTGTGYASYQWFFNTQPIANAHSATYTATQNGVYAVEVTDANGCKDASQGTFISNVGIPNISVNGAGIAVYPNPASDIIHIDAGQKTINVYLCNLEGKLIDYRVNTKEISVANLADGTYFMTITNQDNNILKVQKIVKTGR
ncbi:T9SS type A sorting domain-containing protein [Chitinophagaceae bacterium MMS25-I14]